MNRRHAILACSIVLGSCSSLSSPYFDLFTAEPGIVTLDSRPSGAQASVGESGSCRTPCTLAVPFATEFSVTYTLDGYVTQIIPVKPIPPARRAVVDLTPPRFDPNPVVAELQPLPPPPAPPPVTVTRRQRSQPSAPVPAPAPLVLPWPQR